MARPHHLRHPARGAGFTLIEVMVGLVIFAVLMAIAVPSMRGFIATKRVEAIAQELATDLRFLKSQQLQRRQMVVILFNASGTDTCYTLYVNGANDDPCDCTQPLGSACPNPGSAGRSVELKSVVIPRNSGVTVSASPDMLKLFGFNAAPLGNATLQATIQGTSLGGSVRVSTNVLALPTMCSVAGTSKSFPAC